jgi:UDP-N-acetylglucosamine acyltransferase
VSIHPSAVIHPGAQLGPNVEVGPFAFIDDRVRIGNGTVIGPHAVILRQASLGEGCRVHAGAVVGDLPQDLGFKGGDTFVRIGNRCVIREGVTIHRGTKEGTATEVGDDCFLMALVHLAHNVKLGNRVIMANGSMLGGYVEIGDRAFISGGVVIHQFVKIGRLAMVGGMAGLSKDVPPFCTVESQSRNAVIGLNVIGMRRAGLGVEDRRLIKSAFHRLYRSGLNVSQAVAEMKLAFPTGPASEFVAFIEQSHRGICRFSGTEAEDSVED